MKNKIGISIINTIIGALLILVPTVIFPVCTGDMKMNCMYTEKVAIGIGVVIIILGVFSFFISRKVRIGVEIAIAVLGAFIVSVPTVLIGVCNSDMTCNIATKPALIILGGVLLIVNVANNVYLLKAGE